MAELLLHSLFASKLPKLTLGEIANNVLQKFINVDATTTSLSEMLQENQFYHHGVQSYVESRLGSRKDPEAGDSGAPSLAFLIQMLGILGTRNLVVALRQVRAFGMEWPFLDGGEEEKAAAKTAKGGGKSQFKPDDHLKYALKAQEFCQSHAVEYSEGAAFSGGLFFDWLSLLQAHTLGKNPAVQKYLDILWRESIKAAFISARISERIAISYAKYSFPAALVQNAGKFLICLETARKEGGSDWIEFEKAAEKIPEIGRRDVRYLQEKKRFGFTHDEISALALQYFTILKPIAPAVRYHHFPYYLRNVNHDLFQLASCTALGSILAEHGAIVEKGKNPLKMLETRPWFRELRISEKDLTEITKESSGISL